MRGWACLLVCCPAVVAPTCVCVCVCVSRFMLPHEQDAFEPELAPGHRVSMPRGTGSVGDSAGEGRRERGT